MKTHQIAIKTERDVETALGIKRETNTESNSSTVSNTLSSSKPASLTNATPWIQEKQSLIDKIVSLTSENQKATFELKQSQDDLILIRSANQALETQLNQCKASNKNEADYLQSELSKTKGALEKLRSDNREKILDLTRERDLSQARLQQVQDGIKQQKVAEEKCDRKRAKSSDDDNYEVESILADKIVPKRVYLGGYDSSEDSWVDEANLHCPNILKKYKQIKRK